MPDRQGNLTPDELAAMGIAAGMAPSANVEFRPPVSGMSGRQFDRYLTSREADPEFRQPGAPLPPRAQVRRNAISNYNNFIDSVPATTNDPLANQLGYGDIGRGVEMLPNSPAAVGGYPIRRDGTIAPRTRDDVQPQNLTGDPRDAIVQALMQQYYPQVGSPVGPHIIANTDQQFGPGDGGPAPGAPADNTGGLTFGGIDTSLTGDSPQGTYPDSWTNDYNPADWGPVGVDTGFGTPGGGPASQGGGYGIGGGPGSPGGSPGGGLGPGGGPASQGGSQAPGNSTATPSGSNPPGFEGAPSATPTGSTTYGGPQSAQSVIDTDFNDLTAGWDPSSPGFGATQGVGYTGYSGVPGMGLEGNTGLVGGYSATDPGYSAYTGSMPGGLNATSPTDLSGTKGDIQSSLPGDVYGAYAMAGQTPGLEASFDNPGFSGFGYGDFGFGGYGFGDPSAGDYTGDTSFGDSAPAGGGISDGGYSEASSGGGYGTDGFDGFDGFGDDGFGDAAGGDDDDDGDDE